jgi:putative DNA primase/helicase
MNAGPDFLRASEIHARIDWPAILEQIGIPKSALQNEHGPCPACGGTDRYRFDNRHGRGDFFCNGCGPGDGFTLLMRVHGWTFSEARRRVLEATGLERRDEPPPAAMNAPEAQAPARPTGRVCRLLRSACVVADCLEAVVYLASRGLWPLPNGCTLRASVALDYWHGDEHVGCFPALVATVRDVAGELVTAHVTYLRHGKKLVDHEPRKTLSALTGRAGCAVRLMPATGDTLAVGEGIETCLAAAVIHQVPTWAAVNTSLLARFEPPPEVRQLVVFAARDAPGLEAAARLMEHLQGRVDLELRVPPVPAKDWNDVLQQRGRQP